METVALVSLTTFFATIGPVDIAAIFAGLTAGQEAAQVRRMAFKGVAIGAAILLVFALGGNTVLDHMGISLAALRTAGGILLLLMAVNMVFAKPTGGTTTTKAEADEAKTKNDISVFPLATPLIAGPGAMGAAVLLMADAQGDIRLQAIVIGALLAILLLTLILLLAATWVQKVLGVTGLLVVSRVVGVLLAALAVQFVFDGLATSGLV